MPQQSILPDQPAMTGFALEVRSYPRTPSPDVVQISVKVSTGTQPLKARWIADFAGLERDYLDTLCTSAMSAFMYGETPRDVAKACASVHHLAKAHARQHEF